MFKRRRRTEEEETPGPRSPEAAGRQVYPPPPDTFQPQQQDFAPGPTAFPEEEQAPPVTLPPPPEPSPPPTSGLPPRDVLPAVTEPPLVEPPVTVTPTVEPPLTAAPRAEPAAPLQQQVPPLQVPPPPLAPAEYAPPFMYPPPMIYPPYAMPGYMYGFPTGEQTGQMPTVPPAGMGPPMGALPQMAGVPPVGMVPPMAQIPAPFPPFLSPGLEDPDFEILTSEEHSHWRDDFKWVFGFVTAVLLFLSLTAAGLYRASGPGASRQVMRPVLEKATQIKEYVKKDYQELRSRARRNKSARIVVPDIGVEVVISSDDILNSSSEDLADKVIVEAERKLYSSGYGGDIPMKDARGVGEERAKAVDATLIAVMNEGTHGSLLWVMVIAGSLCLLFAVAFLLFCRGWGRALGLGLALIAGSLPGSLLVRITNEFVWKAGTGAPYKAAMSQAARATGSLMLPFYDIALGVGALVLVIGVVGAVVARKSRERVLPFTELSRPEALVEEDVVLEAGPQTDIFGGAARPQAPRTAPAPPGPQPPAAT